MTSLDRDHNERLSEKMRVAFLLKALPNTLSDRLIEQMDRLKSYKEVHDKVVSLVQANIKHKNGDEMDCSGLDADTVLRDGEEEEAYGDIDAVARDQCARCGGYGHFARDCPTPPSKSKGKGKTGGKAGYYGK